MNAIHPSCLNFHSSEDSFFAFAIKEFAVISKHMNSKYLEIPVWQINFQLFKFSFQHQTAQNTIYLARMVGCTIKTIVNCYYKYSCNIKEIRSGLETLIFEMCYHKTNAHKALKTQRTLPFTNAEKPPKHQLKWFSFPKKKKELYLQSKLLQNFHVQFHANPRIFPQDHLCRTGQLFLGPLAPLCAWWSMLGTGLCSQVPTNFFLHRQSRLQTALSTWWKSSSLVCFPSMCFCSHFPDSKMRGNTSSSNRLHYRFLQLILFNY